MIKEVAFIAIAVSDAERARKFYQETLELKPSTTAMGGAWVEYDLGTTTIGVGCHPDWKPSREGTTVAFEVDKNTRLVVQGITGSAGAFHTRQCMEYGTNVVAGVTPGKGGQMFDGKVPVFDTVLEARQETGCNASMVFVPAPDAADSILEAVDAGVELVVCITEGIPVMDMMRVKALMRGKQSRLI